MSIPIRVFLSLTAVALTALSVRADDYQCISNEGCTALLPTEQGTRTVKFKKGDVVSTSGGWIVNPSEGWSRVH